MLVDQLEEFVRDVQLGLSRNYGNKYIKSKYFYDAFGSQLFEEICLQPEYYITRTESSIIKRNADDILDNIYDNKSLSLVELGSGSSIKTRIFLRSLLQRQQVLYYFPIDVSDSILNHSVQILAKDFPNLKPVGIHADYIEGIQQTAEYISRLDSICTKLIIFLGSSIGNFEPHSAMEFLKLVATKMNQPDHILLGFDLDKDSKILEAAYNDRAGITAKFNKNVLSRINNELGGNFDLDSFSHRSFYNRAEKRIEMHLVSCTDQRVSIKAADLKIDFKNGEHIHTENSYKYTKSDIETLVSRAGLRVKNHYLDSSGWFDMVLACK